MFFFVVASFILTAIGIRFLYVFDLRLRQKVLSPFSGVDQRIFSERFIENASFIILLALGTVFCILWLQGNRTLIFQDLTESYGIFLTASNAKDITTFVLQDISTSPDPAAHPYLYIHHPNLVSRLFAMIGSAFGAGIEELMLVMALISVLSLALGFLALRAAISAEVALAVIVIAVFSYKLFYQQAGDIARAPHYILFWAFLYFYSLKTFIAERPHRIGTGIIVALAAASDWGFFAFFLFFSIAWILYQNRERFPLKELAFSVVLPAALVFLAYFSVVIYALGFDFFLNDIQVTYLGRSGQISSPIFNDHARTEKILNFYKDNNVVIWLGGTWQTVLPDLIRDFFSTNPTDIRWIEKRVVILAFIVFIMYRRVTWLQVTGLAVILWAAYKMWVPVLVLLLAAAIILWMLRQPILDNKSYRDESWREFGGLWPVKKIRDGIGTLLSAQHRKTIDFIVILAAGHIAVFALFPAYLMLLQRSFRPPFLLLELIVLALIASLMLTAFRAIGSSATSSGRIGAAVVACIGLWVISSFGFLGVWNYLRYPPAGVACAGELSKPEYRGKSFIANMDPAAVWYYTRGAAVDGGDKWNAAHPNGHGNPGLLFFSDWKVNRDYYSPEYSLCFKGLGWSIESAETEKINNWQCRIPGKCTCRDIANMLARAGHTPTRIEDEFAVVKINYNSNDKSITPRIGVNSAGER